MGMLSFSASGLTLTVFRTAVNGSDRTSDALNVVQDNDGILH